MFKKIVSILLCITLLGCFGVPVFAAGDQAELYDVYGNSMLFRQNEDAIFSGTATSGATIKVQLFDNDNKLLTQSTTTATDGSFTLSFTAPMGSFEEYTIVLTCNSKEFARLTNIVFGELWLASGQSNMMYPLGQSKVGREMIENGEKMSKWIRVLTEPAYPEYNGKDALTLVPADPQADIVGAKWIDGESDDIYNISAVAAFFAMELSEKLNVPIGILNSSLGGSSIASWISREAIDNCPEVKEALSNHNFYTEKDQWNQEEASIYHTMTANFNLRTNALKNFRPSGMIWYQGETDLMFGYTPEEYALQLELLQKSYTEHFNYKNGLLPLIYTQLAPYYYSEIGLNLVDWNINYTKFQNESPETRAVVTNYDVPLTYLPEAGFIHPECKKEIGQRMAMAAKSLVYGENAPYTASYPQRYEIVESNIFIEFNNTGDGLMGRENTLLGFAICGNDGIYLKADAEITNANTVRVYCDSIKNPVSVTYAYCLDNYKANLYSSYNDALFMPVSPFVIGNVENPHYWADKNWADCEDTVLHHNYVDEISGLYRTWQAENARITVNAENSFNGENGLGIVSLKNTFTVNPLMTYRDGAVLKPFQGTDTNYSDYGTVSFYIRNNGDSPVILENVTFVKNALTCYNPVNNATGDIITVIPADGSWHLVTLDLNTLYVADYKSDDTFSNNVLNHVTDIKFNFSSDTQADISMDNIRFGAEAEENSSSNSFGGIIEKVNSFILMIFRLITQILG